MLFVWKRELIPLLEYPQGLDAQVGELQCPLDTLGFVCDAKNIFVTNSLKVDFISRLMNVRPNGRKSPLKTWSFSLCQLQIVNRPL